MKSPYENTVEVVASALIVNNEDKILLIKSHKWGDMLLLPGGHVEPGESLKDAAQREGEEETGLKLEAQHCISFGELIYEPNFYRKAHLIYFHFLCTALSGDVQLQQDELKEYIWLEPEQAILQTKKTIKQTIENYVNGIKIEIASEIHPRQ